MSAANGSAIPGDAGEVTAKGKGKAVDQTPAQDMSMDEDDSSDEESANGEAHDEEEEEEEEEDDGMEEIDTGNIVAGRTRGKNINWAEADQKAKEAGDDFDDDDDEDDEDFEDHESNDKDAMEE